MYDIEQLAQIPGRTPDEVCIILAAMAGPVPNKQAIVIVGVDQGKTAAYLAWGASRGGGAGVYAVDPDLTAEPNGPVPTMPARRRPAPQRYLARYGLAGVTLVRGTSGTVADDWTSGLVQADGSQVGGGQIGLLLIDRDHSYDGVRADVEAWLPHLHPSAHVLIDGYGGEIVKEVRRAVNDLTAAGLLDLSEIRRNRLAVLTVPPKPAPADTEPEDTEPADEPKLPNGNTGPEPEPEPSAEPPPTPLEDLTIPKLITLAGQRHVELQGGMRKAEIVAALRKAGVEG